MAKARSEWAGVWKHDVRNQKAASLQMVKVPEMSNLRLSAVLTHPNWKMYRFNSALTNVIPEECKLRFIPRLHSAHGNTRKTDEPVRRVTCCDSPCMTLATGRPDGPPRLMARFAAGNNILGPLLNLLLTRSTALELSVLQCGLRKKLRELSCLNVTQFQSCTKGW
jgi:hypothetical protein